ncbi:hypothetical protein [Nonomuraea dietziae]|uniref:hypothetical protein n=1 Tax=Nonomuraea dietziae TaxID=65515 RepID=UPI0031CFF863
MKPFYVRELTVYPVGARRVRLLAVAVLASLVANFETTLATILPLLREDLDMSLEVYGLIAALSVLVGGLSAGFGGILSDRWGRVTILVPHPDGHRRLQLPAGHRRHRRRADVRALPHAVHRGGGHHDHRQPGAGLLPSRGQGAGVRLLDLGAGGRLLPGLGHREPDAADVRQRVAVAGDHHGAWSRWCSAPSSSGRSPSPRPR